MRGRFRSGVAAGVAVCGLLSLTPQVYAQTPPSDAAAPPQGAAALDELEEVVVTARKRAENLQSVPVSVSAFSGEQLKDQSVKNPVDLAGQVPSLNLYVAADDPQSLVLELRGRRQHDTSVQVDPSVGLYIDGLYIPRTTGMRGALLDINRVEVLRGPQGTLYGRNTTGGAISLYTNNPTNELSGSIDATGGNFGAWDVVGVANVPISDALAARFVAERSSHNGYGRALNGEELDSEDSQYYRAKLRATWGNDWEAVVSSHYESDRSGGAMLKLIGLIPADPVAGPVGGGGFLNLETSAEHGLDPNDPAAQAASAAFLQSFIAKANSDFYDNGRTSHSYSNTWKADASATLNGHLSDYLQLRSITGFLRTHLDSLFSSPIPVQFFTGIPINDDNYFSEELQLLGGAQTRFNWVAGVYYGHEGGRDYTGTDLLPSLGPLLATSDNRIRYSSLAGFAQGTWEFVHDWHLTGGVRYSVDKRAFDAISLDGTGTCVVPAPGVDSTPSDGPAQCPRTFQKTFKKPSGLVSLDRQLTPDVLLYAKVAQGYRSGGFNEGGANDLVSFAAFAPETNLEYEAGVKSELLDHRLRLNLDGYHDKYSNLQVSTAVVGPSGFTTVVSNAATAKIWGLEAEAHALIARGLSMHATATYTDARYGTFLDTDPITLLQTVDRSHEPFAVPKWMWSLSGRYVRPTAIGDLALQLDYSWRSTENLDGSATQSAQVTQSPVGLLDARLNLHCDAWNTDIALFGRNITSKKYYENVFSLESLGNNLGFPGVPATYGIEVTKKFDGSAHGGA